MRLKARNTEGAIPRAQGTAITFRTTSQSQVFTKLAHWGVAKYASSRTLPVQISGKYREKKSRFLFGFLWNV